MKLCQLSTVVFMWLGLLMIPTAQAEEEVLPSCGRVDLLWQQDGKVGMGPLYLGMSMQEAQSAGQLVPSKPNKYAACGVANARFMMDDGAIEVIFDKAQQIISLESHAKDDDCSAAQQLQQAQAVFSDMSELPLPNMPAQTSIGSASYYRIGTQPTAWLMLDPDYTQLDNGSCAQ